MSRIQKIFQNERGVTAAEYALVLAVILLVVVATFELLGATIAVDGARTARRDDATNRSELQLGPRVS
ncbi:MAG TPA: hypothetical protein VNO21_00040 [Polyangiaceae bacterium]|nr:hypothetical protein [Polyangiaceae bacterium]